MTRSYPLPSFEEVAEWLHYCPSTGAITWRKDRWYNAKAGTEAGAICTTTGYRRIRFGEKRKIQAHRVAWLLFHGQDPFPLEIDHIDGDRANNRIANLRAVTKQQNQLNRGRNKNNSTGFKGVYRTKGRYMALLVQDQVRRHLGSFATAEEAAAAWQAAALELRGEFFRC